MNYSKLAKERDALGGISPELVQGQEGAGKTAGEGSCQKKCRCVNQKADDQFATFKEEEKFSRWRDELVATKAGVQDTLATFVNLVPPFKQCRLFVISGNCRGKRAER